MSYYSRKRSKMGRIERKRFKMGLMLTISGVLGLLILHFIPAAYFGGLWAEMDWSKALDSGLSIIYRMVISLIFIICVMAFGILFIIVRALTRFDKMTYKRAGQVHFYSSLALIPMSVLITVIGLGTLGFSLPFLHYKLTLENNAALIFFPAQIILGFIGAFLTYITYHHFKNEGESIVFSNKRVRKKGKVKKIRYNPKVRRY